MKRDPVTALTAQLVDRSAERTHLFLVATLHCGRTANAVRVRNLSTSGALIEGASLPPSRSAVVLRRGALEAAGSIAWSAEGKAGVSFEGEIDVAAWFPTKEARPNPWLASPGPAPEQAVDPLRPGSAGEAMPDAAILAELAAVRAQIGQVTNQLASDPSIPSRHPEVKLLGIAQQRIAAMMAALEQR